MIWIWWACQAGTDTTTPFYFRNRRPKRSQKFEFAFVFSRLDWTFELSSTNPLWLCLSWTISQTNVLSSLEDLNTGSHRRGAMRSTKLIQVELNQKSVKHLVTRMIFFPLFGFWGCLGLSLLKAYWNMLESSISSLRSAEWRVSWCPICRWDHWETAKGKG